MGLQKNFELDDSGVMLSYWHLTQVVQHLDACQTEAMFHSYVSESAYKAKKRPAGPAVRYVLAAEDFPPGTDLRALTSAMIYRAVKAKAAAAARLPRDGNAARLPEVSGLPTDPLFGDAVDIGVG